MRIASFKTLKNSRRTRISYAYSAMERDSFMNEEPLQSAADEAMSRLGTMPISEMMDWAMREVEYRQLTC